MSSTADIKKIVPVIAVPNVKDAIDWYERALGFKAGYINRDDADETGDSWNYALLENEGAEIHLSKIVSNDATLSSPCNCYLFVNNIQALHEHLSALQADITPLQSMPWGNLECWLHDPYGNRLVLSATE